MWIYDDIHYYRYLKIYPAIQTPPVEIPGTDGLVCHLVCTRYCPGGEVSKVKPNAHLPETDVEDAALFSIGIESDQSETKLAGRVEICFDDVRLVGSFGDQAKDKFVDWSKPGTVGAGGWSFTPAQTLYYHMNGYAGYSHPGFFAPTLVKVVDIKFKLFYPGEKTDSSYTTHPVGLGKLNHLQLVADIKGLLGDTETSDIVIQSKEKKFHCHRTILCARSSVLRRLLDTDMKETRSGVIAVDDIDMDALYNISIQMRLLKRLKIQQVLCMLLINMTSRVYLRSALASLKLDWMMISLLRFSSCLTDTTCQSSRIWQPRESWQTKQNLSMIKIFRKKWKNIQSM